MIDPHRAASPPMGFAFALHVVPALAYLGVLFYTGLIRLGPLPEVGPVPTDKLLHTVAFGGLALLLMRATWFLFPSQTYSKRAFSGVCLASLFGALLEVCQSFVPYRSAELLDWVADTLGAVLAVGLLTIVRRIVPRRAHG